MGRTLQRLGILALLFGILTARLIASEVAAADAKDKEAGKHEEKASDHKKVAKKDVNPFEHVMDSDAFHLFETGHIQIKLFSIGSFQLSKFMVLELMAAGLVALIYIPMARRLQSGEPPRGAWDNCFESFLTFLREEVVKPNLGDHGSDKYVPFIWTMFLFILFCNLLGMVPFLGSPTANVYVTGGLALCSFAAIHGFAIAKMGVGHYLKSLWPHMDIPFGIGYVLKPMICGIEVFGNFIKAGVLAIRLFANMFAGHTVLAMILLFIVMAGNAGFAMWAGITVGSVLGVVALSLLELFVAFLQAYIFVFLTALFMGMALHPQH